VSQIREYIRPRSVEEAYGIYQEVRAAFLAGGTLLTQRKSIEIDSLIDLQAVGLNYIKGEKQLIRIGSMTTITEIAGSEVIAQSFSGTLNKSARRLGSPAVRNLSTIGGNIMSRVYWSDIVPVLLAMDADLLLFDGEPHKVGIGSLLKDARLRQMLLVEVIVPKGGKGFYRRFSRTAVDIPQVVSVLIQSAEVRAVVGGLWKVPQRVERLEKAIAAGRRDEAEVRRIISEDVKAFSDLGGGAQFKKEVASALFVEMIEELRVSHRLH